MPTEQTTHFSGVARVRIVSDETIIAVMLPNAMLVFPIATCRVITRRGTERFISRLRHLEEDMKDAMDIRNSTFTTNAIEEIDHAPSAYDNAVSRQQKKGKAARPTGRRRKRTTTRRSTSRKHKGRR